jgi:hypothetical protein
MGKMTHTKMVRVVTLAVTVFCSSCVAGAQAASGGAAAPSIPASSGTYSIESEILAYKSLRANSAEIASELVVGRGSYKDAKGNDQGRNLILVPSSSTAVPAFQLWRSHMVIVHNLLKQANDLLPGGDGCPTAPQPTGAPAPSFAAYTTAIGQGVTALQGIISLFANSQSVNEFTGTIQDQALMLAVARELRKSNVTVLTPDIYGPATIAGIEPDTYPFISILGTLIDQHSKLQKAYICNAVAATAAGQLQQAEVARETDYTKLAALGTADGDRASKPLLDDIALQKGLLAFLRERIGLKPGDLTTINTDEEDIVVQGRIVGNLAGAAKPRADALAKIHSDDVDISNLELPAITKVNLEVAQVMSLITGIESYLSSLTGGSITLMPPVAPAAPASSTTPTTPTPSPAAAAGTPAPATPAPATPAPSASTSTPTLVAVLQADGLAAKMGFTVAVGDHSVASTQLDQWRIVWLKALESGGAIINEATIWGSHPYFGGGAVSGYGLYQLNGDLVCSANVASYGGYVKAKDFPGFVSDPSKDGTVHAIEIGGDCASGKP